MISLDFGLADVHVLITGASGGIGIALVRTFLELNGKVTAHYNTDPRDLSNMSHPNLTLVQANVTSETDVLRLFDDALSRHGVPVQVLVVNHGIFVVEDNQVADMTLSQWRNTQSVNLESSFLCAASF